MLAAEAEAEWVLERALEQAEPVPAVEAEAEWVLEQAEPVPAVEAEEERVAEPLPAAPEATAARPADEGDDEMTVVELVKSTVPTKAAQRRRRRQ